MVFSSLGIEGRERNRDILTRKRAASENERKKEEKDYVCLLVVC